MRADRLDPNGGKANVIRRLSSFGGIVMLASAMTLGMSPTAKADNKRLNDSVVANVYTVQHQHGCSNNVTSDPQLRLRPSGTLTTS